jgi:hypothetical protein
MVGCGSPAWPEGTTVAGRASTLRARLITLAKEDVVSLASLLDVLRDSTDGQRGERLSSALLAASRPALAIVEAAAEIAELAAAAEGEEDTKTGVP